MAPEGSKRAIAARPAGQNESGKRRKRADKKKRTEPSHGGSSTRLLYERHGGAAAVAAAAAAGARAVAGQIENDSASEGGKEPQNCTCGECLDGWLSPAMADALGQVAQHARTDVEDALSYVMQEGLDENKLLRRKHLREVMSQAKVLRDLPQSAQSRMTAQVLRVYAMLFQGIENLLQAGQAADSDEIGAAWQELVGKRVRQFGEHELPELVDQHCVRSMREGLERECQRELLTHLVRQARKYRRGEEVAHGRCANDDEYEGVLQRMLGPLAPDGAALSEGEGSSSDAGDSSDIDNSSGGGYSSEEGSEYEEEEDFDNHDNWEDDYEQGAW